MIDYIHNLQYFCRCFFKIVPENGQVRPNSEVVVFGSVVRLIQEPTKCTVVASGLEDTGSESSFGCVCLRRSLSSHDDLAAQWLLTSRYKLRSEGDAVQTDDFIILKNARYRNRHLTKIPSIDPGRYDHMVGLQRNYAELMKEGWQLKILSSFPLVSKVLMTTKETRALIGGDYIRLLHQEESGQLIVRADDSQDYNSLVAPLVKLV